MSGLRLFLPDTELAGRKKKASLSRMAGLAAAGWLIKGVPAYCSQMFHCFLIVFFFSFCHRVSYIASRPCPARDETL